MSDSHVDCLIKAVPKHKLIEAMKNAIRQNPRNSPPPNPLVTEPAHLALLTSKYWGAQGVNLTVGFMESTAQNIRDRIISHMNAWQKYANITFRYSQTDPQVRISRGGQGYWSYLGTDILSISKRQPTMNLQGFTNSTPESEYIRVVRHETGHTLGFPHEHARQEIIDLLDYEKTIAYFMKTQGWSREEVIQQVLEPLDPASIRATAPADQVSIMTYSFPGAITKSGQPIKGGTDINPLDGSFANACYPKNVTEPPVPGPGPGTGSDIVIRVKNAEKITVDGYTVTKNPGTG